MVYTEFLYDANPNPILFGGKGSNLIKLHNFGITIPPGFILTTELYRKFLEKSFLKEQLNKILPEDYKPQEAINLSIKVKNLFLQSEMPNKIYNEIETAFNKARKIYGKNITFAVRSSASIEDSKDFSFAGQAESYLYSRTLDEIISSLKNCWASLYSPQALLYLFQIRKKGKNIPIHGIEMAVIIQKMIDSQVSGVLFTVNVINNNQNQMMINSTWGLGETITDNKVIPDLIIINKDDGNIEKLVMGEKELKSIANPKGSSTVLVETEQNLRSISSLNQNQIQQLYDLGLKIEKKFDYPQDIEWAIENNEIYILQTRPITTL